MTARARILRYLKQTRWAQRRLAELCQIQFTGLNHIVSGRRPISVEQAMKIEKGTRAAFDTGLTQIEPVLARELIPPSEEAAVRRRRLRRAAA